MILTTHKIAHRIADHVSNTLHICGIPEDNLWKRELSNLAF